MKDAELEEVTIFSEDYHLLVLRLRRLQSEFKTAGFRLEAKLYKCLDM
jgi:hypothetical protein